MQLIWLHLQLFAVSAVGIWCCHGLVMLSKQLLGDVRQFLAARPPEPGQGTRTNHQVSRYSARTNLTWDRLCRVSGGRRRVASTSFRD